MTNESFDVAEAWARTAAKLPPGWELDGLRCASTGMSPEDRSEEWIAVAIGPDGRELQYRAVDPGAALAGLASLVVKPTL
jgi:hypothetical protein